MEINIQCISGNSDLLAQVSKCTASPLHIFEAGLSPEEYVDGFNQETPSLLIVDADAFTPEALFDDFLPLHRKLCSNCSVAIIARDDLHQRVLDAINAHHCERLIEFTADTLELECHLNALLHHTQRLALLREQLISSPAKHLFVTGVTGFLGREFLKEVLRSTNHRVTALTRDKQKVPYDERISFRAEDYPDRLDFVKGDLRRLGLGLSLETIAELTESVDEIWHFAAITSFDEILRPKIFKINLEGTETLIEFAQKLPKLTCFNHISTTYVAGTQTFPTVIAESIAAEKPAFKNPYEESKFLAERSLAQSGLPYLIYRPSIVLGESVSGRSDGQTLYNVAKMVRLAKLLSDRDSTRNDLPLDHHSFRVVADSMAFKNMVPVDDVISMCLRIRAANPPLGSIFHTAHPEAGCIDDLVEVITKNIRIDHHEIVPTLEGETLSVPEKVLERVAEVFTPYMLSSDPVFDMKNVHALLGDSLVPAVDREYLYFCIDAFYRLYFGATYNAVMEEA